MALLHHKKEQHRYRQTIINFIDFRVKAEKNYQNLYQFNAGDLGMFYLYWVCVCGAFWNFDVTMESQTFRKHEWHFNIAKQIISTTDGSKNHTPDFGKFLHVLSNYMVEFQLLK